MVTSVSQVLRLGGYRQWRNHRLETSWSQKQVTRKAVSKVAPKTASKFQLQNTSLPDEVETALGCQASLLGSFSPLGRTGYATRSSEAQDRVMQSRNWHFLLGLSSSDLFTRAKPAGLAPGRESSSGPRAGPVSILLPSAPLQSKGYPVRRPV